MKCVIPVMGHKSHGTHLVSHFVLQIIRQAVSGMLPKNKLRERRLERLRIFPNEDMGILQHNIVKRWEDGTLTPTAQKAPNVSITTSAQ